MSDPALLILSSLAGGEKHGYAIMADVESFAGIRLGPGTLYGAISRLEETGWIMPVGADTRRQAYRMTAAGQTQLRAQLAQLEKIVRTAGKRLQPV